MSGHSKWSTIKHQKGATDAKRGKLFSKLGRAISVVVREGKSDNPENNARLRLAIEQAKAINMPKENINRAIERGMGRGGTGQLETVIYEGFGPEKTGLMIECVTDNKNRTGSEIKSFLERGGGGLGSPGSANYLFEKKGLILVEKSGNSEEQILKLIDLGIEDVEEEEDFIEVYTKPEQLEEIKEKITKAGFVIKEASLVFKPLSLITIEEQTKKDKLLHFLETVEDLDEVQKVYCNADFVVK